MDDVTQILFDDIKSIKEKLELILVQTTKTNGRVTTLENNIDMVCKNLADHITNCPTKLKVNDMKEDNRTSNQKKWDIVKGIINTAITVLFSVISAWLLIRLGLK